MDADLPNKEGTVSKCAEANDLEKALQDANTMKQPAKEENDGIDLHLSSHPAGPDQKKMQTLATEHRFQMRPIHQRRIRHVAFRINTLSRSMFKAIAQWGGAYALQKAVCECFNKHFFCSNRVFVTCIGVYEPENSETSGSLQKKANAESLPENIYSKAVTIYLFLFFTPNLLTQYHTDYNRARAFYISIVFPTSI